MKKTNHLQVVGGARAPPTGLRPFFDAINEVSALLHTAFRNSPAAQEAASRYESDLYEIETRLWSLRAAVLEQAIQSSELQWKKGE